jgi:hypothetical protein
MRCALCGSGYVIALLVTGLLNLRIIGSAAATTLTRRLVRTGAPRSRATTQSRPPGKGEACLSLTPIGGG